MKLFFRTFGIVVLAEIVLAMAATVVQQATNSTIVRTVCGLIMQVISLPLSLVNRTYPYYSLEPGWVIAIMMVATYIMHTVIVYLVYKAFKKQAFT
jgi:ethanolamine transporter EutH